MKNLLSIQSPRFAVARTTLVAVMAILGGMSVHAQTVDGASEPLQRNLPQRSNAPTSEVPTLFDPSRSLSAPTIPSINGADPRPGAAGIDLRGSGRSTPTKAAAPSEFQRFVEAATGRRLNVFGVGFFVDAPNTDLQAPVPADHLVSVGDEVVIRAWGSVDVNYRAVVDRNGQIALPKVGTISVAGARASELQQRVRAQIARQYTNFNLSVSLGQLRGITVFAVGQAARPGSYALSNQSSLLSAVMAAGGPGPNGSMRRVSVRRGGQLVGDIDLYDFLVQGDRSRDVQLVAGDSVVFHPVGPRVALSGAIDTPAIYELRSRDETLRDLLRYAGGAPILANSKQVQVERIDPKRPEAPRTIEVFGLDDRSLAQGLRDGDVLTLLALSPQFSNAVTLKGHVAQPMRYAFKPGMRLRDLVPSRDALVSADYHRRKNLLVQVQAIAGDELLALLRERERYAAASPRKTPDGQWGAAPTTSPEAADRPGFFPGANDDRPPAKSRPAERKSREQLFDDDMARADLARKRPAELFDEVNWDYALIERLNPKDLSTQLLTFSPRKAFLENDESANLELMAGDVVTIFSQRDLRVPVARQTRIVQIEGEVASAGVYQLQGGETLQQLVARAGGFTPQAYLYGLELQRLDTRKRQQENLDAAIRRLESLSATQAARNAANTSGDVSAATAAQSSAAATDAQLRTLRTLQPSGRIALELEYSNLDQNTLPDLPLEHGDRVVVPARPSFVTIAGAVANNNAFLWREGRTVDDFLRLAGVEEAADRSQTFILRADGTVVHSTDKRGLWGIGGGIGSTPLYPGDAVIVPNQLDYETWGRALVRNLKDWSQIFSQFGLGAAAIVTLRNQ